MSVQKKFGRYGIILSLFMILLVACSKMDHNYSDFIKDGEIIYTGKVDSVKTYPGHNRILLEMLLLSDPKISKVKVFWNDKQDSAVQNVVRSSGVDTVRFMLTNMPEATYAFQIYTYDNEGHSSVKTEKIGIVYGQNYINTLFNRSLKSVTYVAPSKARLIWFGPSSQTIGQQIQYIDSLGVNQNFIEPVWYYPLWAPGGKLKDTTMLNTFKRNEYFQYRTLYKPEVNAIDTFFSSYQSVQVL